MHIKINDPQYKISKERAAEIKSKLALLFSVRYFVTVLIGGIINSLILFVILKYLLDEKDFTMWSIAFISFFVAIFYGLIGCFITTEKERVLKGELGLFSSGKEKLEQEALKNYLDRNINKDAPKELRDFIEASYHHFEYSAY